MISFNITGVVLQYRKNGASSLSGWLKIEALGCSETLVSIYNSINVVISVEES
jgi:hypothetical protein